jgi:hypothetical protein
MKFIILGGKYNLCENIKMLYCEKQKAKVSESGCKKRLKIIWAYWDNPARRYQTTGSAIIHDTICRGCKIFTKAEVFGDGK